MGAKKLYAAFVACFLLAGIAWVEAAPAGGPGNANPGIELRPRDFSMLSPHSFWPACGCPDIAYTKTFQSEGLGYAGSPEFAAAIRAVAGGASEFSPDRIPADWRTAAESWDEYLQLAPDEESRGISPVTLHSLRDGEMFRFPKGKYACIPDLVHLASLEYRKMQARSSLKPVSAGAVRTAVKELEANIASKRQMAPRLAERAKTIASRIAEAERLGAGNCSPGGVARTREELEQAFIEARLARSPSTETESLFDQVERYANYLLSERRLASNRGDGCR